MDSVFIAVAVCIGAALLFGYTNGFHDSANAIATSISTRALKPRVALGMAAIGNFVGAHLGGKVAATVASGLVELPDGIDGILIVIAGLLGAITWNFITWYFGLPTSSSHSLFGGMVGATIAGGAVVLWGGILDKIVIPTIVSPLVGFTLGFLVMIAVYWLFRRGRPDKLNRGFRHAQTVSAAAMAVGHGMQDAAKVMGIIILALSVGGYYTDGAPIPEWVYLASAAVMAAGTYAGGWRIIKTMGRKIIDLGPPQGFAAETVASAVLYTNTFLLGAPISTTHTITSAIMGVGSTGGKRAVRWGVARSIVIAWIITFPIAALVGALFYLPIQFIG
ncbi:inorganic phosphate transporter [Glycomyces algeriensis]|uniref:Inorganic phosphate transporter n=1 Tax=Glycomyces algeriensis TaxID=256037 RepID=A0A9W6LF60_9ACTN|nr:inorganic phosphate transporter [Glycomyces algeriensis]MDA1367587.1 inorganic phosphate transporter [Glycomyces algeriensis]MDR7353050.1 PiT family inorganic phosphate transporter [Glycomyces algeriensis]GLI40740.1 inorganic phosphate transporter [Glycomyces algeriensis]